MTYNVYVTGCFSSQQKLDASSRAEAIDIAISNLEQQASDLFTIDIHELEADLEQPYVSLRAHYSSPEQPQPQQEYVPMASVFTTSVTEYTPFVN